MSTPATNIPTSEDNARDIEQKSVSSEDLVVEEVIKWEEPIRSLSSSRRTIRIALVSIYTALILGLDYLPRPPNVEFMTCLLFVGGYCFGSLVGGTIGVVVGAIFSYANPLGPSQPLLYAFQIIFYASMGIIGDLFSRTRRHRPFVINWRSALTLGVLGVIITLVFDIGATFASFLLLTNWNWLAVWPYWFIGLAFTITHVVSNAIIFAFLLPVVANAILMHFGFIFAKPFPLRV